MTHSRCCFSRRSRLRTRHAVGFQGNHPFMTTPAGLCIYSCSTHLLCTLMISLDIYSFRTDTLLSLALLVLLCSPSRCLALSISCRRRFKEVFNTTRPLQAPLVEPAGTKFNFRVAHSKRPLAQWLSGDRGEPLIFPSIIIFRLPQSCGSTETSPSPIQDIAMDALRERMEVHLTAEVVAKEVHLLLH